VWNPPIPNEPNIEINKINKPAPITLLQCKPFWAKFSIDKDSQPFMGYHHTLLWTRIMMGLLPELDRLSWWEVMVTLLGFGMSDLCRHYDSQGFENANGRRRRPYHCQLAYHTSVPNCRCWWPSSPPTCMHDSHPFFCLTHNYIHNCKSSQNLKKLWITQVCSPHQSCERTYTTVTIVSQLEKLRISASTTLDAKYS
jgi:hypothetical protein